MEPKKLGNKRCLSRHAGMFLIAKTNQSQRTGEREKTQSKRKAGTG